MLAWKIKAFEVLEPNKQTTNQQIKKRQRLTDSAAVIRFGIVSATSA